MDQSDLSRRLWALESRIARLERAFRIGKPEVVGDEPPMVAGAAEPKQVGEMSQAGIGSTGTGRIAPRPVEPVIAPIRESAVGPPAAPPPLPVMVPPVPLLGAAPVLQYHEPESAQSRVVDPDKAKLAKEIIGRASREEIASRKPAEEVFRRMQSLEELVGLKWTGWVGAIVLLIGVSLGVRFAYEQGWFSGVPDWVRLSMISIGGFGLIGLGEWAYRKVNRVPAACLFGAGIATLFVAAYAGNAYYHLYDRGAAFTLMAVAALVGATIARRGNMVTIGVISLIGGNLAPLLLRAEHPHPAGFLLYLAMLEGIALFLCFKGNHPKWWVLRALSWMTTAGWMGLMIGTDLFGAVRPALTLSASVIFALAYQVELIGSTARSGKPTGRDWSGAPAVMSLLVTASLALAAWLALSTASGRVTFILGEAALCLLTYPQLRKRGMEELAQSFETQSLALLAAAVPIGLSRQWIILGWGALSVVMAWQGRKTGRAIPRAMSILVWLGGVSDLIWNMTPNAYFDVQTSSGLVVHGAAISIGLLLAWGLAMCGEIVAWLSWPRGENERMRQAALFLCAGSAVVWCGFSMGQLPVLGATVAIVALAWVLAAGDFFTSRLGYGAQAMALLLLATLKWGSVDVLHERLAANWARMQIHPLINDLMGVGALLAISLIAVYRSRRRSILEWARSRNAGVQEVNLLVFLAFCVIGVLTVAFSLEIDLFISAAVAKGLPLPWPAGQMEQLALTFLWSGAVAALWSATAVIEKGERLTTRTDAVGKLAWALAAKFAIVDCLFWYGSPVTAMGGFNLSIASALAVGALLIGISMVVLRPWIGVSRPAGPALAMGIGIVWWGGMFEIQRLIARNAIWIAWPPMEMELLAFTAWWAAGAALLFALMPRLAVGESQKIRSASSAALIILAIKYLTLDTIPFRLSGSLPATTMIDPLAAAAGALVIGLGMVWWPSRNRHARGMPAVAGFLLMLVLLWLGTLEIDRLFGAWAGGTFANAELARQGAISIFWSMFAILAVVFGFRLPAASTRYFGLGLFALTLAKVLFEDVWQLGEGYHVLSLLGLGGLLLGTSVLYGKLSPRLLHANGN
jgi:uncharacterized membrane protein